MKSNHYDQILTNDADLNNITYQSAEELEAQEPESDARGFHEDYDPAED